MLDTKRTTERILWSDARERFVFLEHFKGLNGPSKTSIASNQEKSYDCFQEIRRDDEDDDEQEQETVHLVVVVCAK